MYYKNFKLENQLETIDDEIYDKDVKNQRHFKVEMALVVFTLRGNTYLKLLQVSL